MNSAEPDEIQGTTTYSVHLQRSGRTLQVSSATTILEAGIAAGVRLPFACTVGGCLACKKRLLSGEVEVQEPTGLPPAQRAKGMILLCRTRARSDLVLDV